jgi:hypothetical protein
MPTKASPSMYEEAEMNETIPGPVAVSCSKTFQSAQRQK